VVALLLAMAIQVRKERGTGNPDELHTVEG
jgi:hypothetical protein